MSSVQTILASIATSFFLATGPVSTKAEQVL